MELTINNNNHQIIDNDSVITTGSSSFIEANTKAVSLNHLKNDCIIPVFSKDNESTISHYEFINQTRLIVAKLFPGVLVSEPAIRVSHVVKGRIPSAIGKPANALLEHEKTLYYERLAFTIDFPEIQENVNGNTLQLQIGGVRALNQENLYSRKTLEKFKVFIGFKNMVCTNMCIATDGVKADIRIGSINDLEPHITGLFTNYNKEKHLGNMEKMSKYELSEYQFAHLIGKLRMFNYLSKAQKQKLFQVALTDSQINNVVKDYYKCPNFKRADNGSINMWNLYNLFTEANKSSYIDNNFERNVNAYELVNNLADSLEYNQSNWFLP